jgi:integrase
MTQLKRPKHTKLIGNVYHYRKLIPKGLRQHFGNKQHIEGTLRTRDRKEAQNLAFQRHLEDEAKFLALREKRAPSEEGLMSIAKDFYLSTKIAIPYETKYKAHQETKNKFIPTDIHDLLAELRRDRITGDLLNIAPIANVLIKSNQLIIDPLRDFEDKPTELFRHFCMILLEAWIRAIEDHLNPKPILTITDSQNKAVGVTLQELYDKDSEHLQGANIKGSGSFVKRFIQLMGNLDIGLITKKTVFEYCRILAKIDAPTSRKSAKVKDWLIIVEKSASLEPGEFEPLSLKTVKNELISAKALFDVSAVNDEFSDSGSLLSDNPFNISTKGHERIAKLFKKTDRLPYTPGEIKTIFTSKAFEGLDKSSENYWGLLMLFYTGARPVEVGTLRLTDISENSGFYQINIDESKTQAGERTIPIHNDLIRLGLLKRMESLKSASETLLFPKWGAHKWSDVTTKGVSKWLNREFLPSLGLKYSEQASKKESATYSKKDGYSLRHTFQDALRNCGVADEIIKKLVGHRSNRLYGIGEEIKLVNSELQKLDTQTLFGFKL